ncbi:uncharacterized protein OCT59_023386 [Rhizophagus irregularis]|uniref:uncharacterized protein n=1 Tax=Rhizophagus irregularis TaxID=588596 RepID=UPI0019ECC051|nr:hypothetical protein OCT59_023386 [Rhizophagus irregularis]GET58233.1 hypothetical protein GLOIN_2v1824211 [Rhizophagus irregularis DAOM 181602=DAOM 197198]
MPNLTYLNGVVLSFEAENFNLKREVANLRKELGNKIEELEKNGEDAESRLAKVEQDSSVVNEHQSNNVSSFRHMGGLVCSGQK